MRKRLVVKKKDLITYLLLIFFFRPDFINEMYSGTFVDTFFVLGRVFSAIYILMKYFLAQNGLKKKSFNVALSLLLIYQVSLIFFTILNKQNISGRIINLGNAIGVLCLFLTNSERKLSDLIKEVFNFFYCLVFINGFLTILFPNGLNNSFSEQGRVNFLGKDNVLTLSLLFLIGVSLIYKQYYPKDKRPNVAIAISLLSEIYYRSGTGIIAMIVIVLFWLLSKFERFSKVCDNPLFILIIFLLLEYLFVFLEDVSDISAIFLILGKSSTFSDRMYYWNAAKRQISASPLIGIGNGTVDLWNNNYYSHNAILDVLMKGGIFGLILWLVEVFVPFFSCWKKSKDNIAKILNITLFSFLIVGLMEGLEDRAVFYALISLAYSYMLKIENLDKKPEIVKNID